MGNFRSPSLGEEILRPNIHARAKVTRMKSGSSRCMQSQQMCADFYDGLF